MKVFYSTNYHASDYSFDTTRKSLHIANKLTDERFTIIDPSAYNEETYRLLCGMHDKSYVDAVMHGTPRHLAESQGFGWDKKSPSMYLAHNAGCIGALDSVIEDGSVAVTLSSGLHHARTSRGSAFCTFNGVALTAMSALQRGLQNILILDFDAHAGGGTMEFVLGFGDKVTHRDVITSPFDVYEVEREQDILVYSDPTTYVNDIKLEMRYLRAVHARTPFDLVIYNAGMDPVNSGVTVGDLDIREQEVFSFVGDHKIPTVVTMAGGYTTGSITNDVLADIHMLTLNNAEKVSQ